ncbi:MAG: Ig-like domain-containing protein, partial [Pseudomonadota bacterium]
FDEFYSLNDVSSQVFISPALKENPKLKIKNKSLLIEIKDSLEQNTTYTIYFGNAIRDVNEGNVLKNFQYVFSTGNYIDSMRISGFVKSVTDNKPISNATVMLYKSLDDSVIVKSKPNYFIKTDEAGFFQLNHLKSGKYKLFALQDLNANYKYEFDELIAFSDSIIDIKDTSAVYQLNMFKAAPKKNKTISAVSMGQGKIKLILANRVDSFYVKLLNPETEIRNVLFNNTSDTIQCFINPALKDSVVIFLGDKSFSDTVSVRLKFEKSLKDTSNKNNKPALISNLISNNAQKILLFGSSLQFKSNYPIKKIDKLKVEIVDLVDTTTSLKNNINLIINEISNEQSVRISADFKSEHFYLAKISAGFISDFDNNINDSLTLKFQYSDEASIGNLKIKFAGLDSTQHYIAQVLNEKKEIVFLAAVNGNQTILKFNKLTPRKYFLHLIEDKNNNGLWDSGNYWQHLQPEKIYNYLQEINVRSNWDLDITMNIATGNKRK